MTDEQLDRLIVSTCHSDPRTKDGEYCLTLDEVRALLAARDVQSRENDRDAELGALVRKAVSKLSDSPVSLLLTIERAIADQDAALSSPASRSATKCKPHGLLSCTDCDPAFVSQSAEKRGASDGAVKLLDTVIYDMEHGFVRCENCGEQEDTRDLDFMYQLRELRAIIDPPYQAEKRGEDDLVELLEDARDYVDAFSDDKEDGHIAKELCSRIDAALAKSAEGK